MTGWDGSDPDDDDQAALRRAERTTRFAWAAIAGTLCLLGCALLGVLALLVAGTVILGSVPVGGL
jgi:hypothetical protein